jgi:hypothetical protein
MQQEHGTVLMGDRYDAGLLAHLHQPHSQRVRIAAHDRRRPAQRQTEENQKPGAVCQAAQSTLKAADGRQVRDERQSQEQQDDGALAQETEAEGEEDEADTTRKVRSGNRRKSAA